MKGEEEEFAVQLADIRQLISQSGAEQSVEEPVLDQEIEVDATFQFHPANYPANKSFNTNNNLESPKDHLNLPETQDVPDKEEINVENVRAMSQASYAKIISIS